ncbi:MAG: DUF2946 family protein [Pseudomonadota bacterium]|jgi:hypothetical protein
MRAHAERRAMIALVAVFVLLVQALAPTLASAGTFPGGGLSICTKAGLAPSSDGDAAPLGHDCQHCVCPAAAVEPPSIVSVRPVAYADSTLVVADTPRGVRPQARAPPRPPGQGPPPSIA